MSATVLVWRGHEPLPAVLRTKALAYLRDGRVRVMEARTTSAGRLTSADVIVYGHRAEHMIGWNEHGWSCSCPKGRLGQVCTHLVAAELILHGVMPPGRDGQPKARPVKA